MFIQSQSVYASLAHRCWNFSWSEARNLAVYGTQASAEGLGANWRIEVSVQSEIGDDLNLTPHLNFLKSKVDHSTLWLDLSGFEHKPSTIEAVTVHLANELFSTPIAGSLSWKSLTVHESPLFSVTATKGQSELKITVRQNNLTLICAGELDQESGLVVSRDLITREVKSLLQERTASTDEEGFIPWAEGLLGKLKRQVHNLEGLRIEIRPNRFVQVFSHT